MVKLENKYLRSQNNHADALARLATSEGENELERVPFGWIN